MEPSQSLPRDLPGRYGKTIKDLERLLKAAQASSVVAGGWAVWSHGYVGRVTEDVDIVIGQGKIETVQHLAQHFGFEFYSPPPGKWPKMIHRSTKIDVDILPEFGIPGTPSRPAPVPIGHPTRYQAVEDWLTFIPLTGLIELKLGAGRAKDIADVVELIKVHSAELPAILQHLATVHLSYKEQFSELIRQAAEE